MVAARFIGDPRHGGDGPASVTMWGHTFAKGVWTELTTETAVLRARGNDHFEVRDEAVAETPRPAEVVDEAPQADLPGGIPANWRELHHFKRIALAKQLAPELADTIKTGKDADSVIEWHAEGKDFG